MSPHGALAWLVFTVVVGCALGCMTQLVAGFVRTWLAGRNAEETLQRIEVLAREANVAEALAVAHRLPGSVALIVVAGFRAPDEATAERAIEDAARDERTRLTKDVRVLDVLGATAVLLPLAGIGITTAFADAPIPLDEWRWSLVVLAAGLGTAVIATLGRFWLTARIRRLAVDMEKGAALVYNTAR